MARDRQAVQYTEVAAPETQPLAYDFYHFWAAGVVIRAGSNPYDVSTLKPVMSNLGWPETEQVFGFLHPFWTAWFFSAISLLPFTVAALTWCAAVIGLTGLCVWLLVDSDLRHRIQLRGPKAFLFCAAALFPPLISTVAHGQSNVIPLVGIVGWMAAFSHGSRGLGGVVLSLTTFKPQLFVPLYILVFVSELRRREIRGLTGFVGGWILQAAISLLINWQIFSLWLAALHRASESTTNLPTPTLSRMLSTWTGDPGWALYLIVASSLLAVTVALRHQGDLVLKSLVFLPLSALAAPYVWGHAFLPLLPVYLVLVGFVAEGAPRRAVYGCALFALFGICEIIRPHLLAPTMVCIPLVLLAFVILRDGKWLRARPGY